MYFYGLFVGWLALFFFLFSSFQIKLSFWCVVVVVFSSLRRFLSFSFSLERVVFLLLLFVFCILFNVIFPMHWNKNKLQCLPLYSIVMLYYYYFFPIGSRRRWLLRTLKRKSFVPTAFLCSLYSGRFTRISFYSMRVHIFGILFGKRVIGILMAFLSTLGRRNLLFLFVLCFDVYSCLIVSFESTSIHWRYRTFPWTPENKKGKVFARLLHFDYVACILFIWMFIDIHVDSPFDRNHTSNLFESGVRTWINFHDHLTWNRTWREKTRGKKKQNASSIRFIVFNLITILYCCCRCFGL